MHPTVRDHNNHIWLLWFFKARACLVHSLLKKMKRAITIISDSDGDDLGTAAASSEEDRLLAQLVPPTTVYQHLFKLFSNAGASHPMAPMDYIQFCTSQLHNYERYGILLFNSGFPVSLGGVVKSRKDDKSVLYDAIYKACGGKLTPACIPVLKRKAFIPFHFIVFILHTGDSKSGHWSILVCPLLQTEDVRFMHFDSLGGSSGNYELAKHTVQLLREFEIIANADCNHIVESAPAPFHGIQDADLSCGSWLLWPLQLLQQLSLSNLLSYNDMLSWLAAHKSIPATFPNTEFQEASILFTLMEEHIRPYFAWLAANQKSTDPERAAKWTDEFWPKLPRIRSECQILIEDGPPISNLDVMSNVDAWPLRTKPKSCALKPKQVLNALLSDDGLFDEDIIRMYLRTNFLCNDSRRCVISLDLDELVRLKSSRMERRNEGNFYAIWVYVPAVASGVVRQLVLFVQPMILNSTYQSGPLLIYSGYATEMFDIVATPPANRTHVQNALIECVTKLQLRNSPFAGRGSETVAIRTTTHDKEFDSLVVSLALLRVACFEPEMLPVTPKAYELFFYAPQTQRKRWSVHKSHTFFAIRRTLLLYLLSQENTNLFLVGSRLHSKQHEATEHYADRVVSLDGVVPLRQTVYEPIQPERVDSFSVTIECGAASISCTNTILEHLLYTVFPLRNTVILLSSGPGWIYRQLAIQQLAVSVVPVSGSNSNTYAMLILRSTKGFTDELTSFIRENANQPRPLKQMEAIKASIAKWSIRDMLHLFFYVFTQRCLYKGIALQ